VFNEWLRGIPSIRYSLELTDATQRPVASITKAQAITHEVGAPETDFPKVTSYGMSPEWKVAYKGD
jgi:hypothetical protein